VVQTCIVHQIRNSLKSVAWSDRRSVAASLKPVYQAATEESGLDALGEFESQWGEKYPMIGRSWLNNWDRLSPFFAFPEAIRRAIYTTNPIEGLNRQLRKILKTKGALPSEESALKLMYLAILRIGEKWTYPMRGWKQAMHQFAIFFDGRMKL
jgi:putative transposase